jgi:DNA repair protein SbcD/Mre11
MTKPSLKIVHTSDVHLDCRNSVPGEDGFRNVSERAFGAVVNLVLAESADLFLIAGDLFDSNRVNDADFEFVYSQLRRLQCPVVLIPGNHDVHDETSVWDRIDLARLGSHIHALSDPQGCLIELPEIRASVWGRGMVEHAPDNIPLDGVAKGPSDYWHIGMAHGDVLQDRSFGCSSPITYDEIGDSDLHYLGLGHVHVWRHHDYGKTRACYPGSPVAEYATSAGGYAAIVTLGDEIDIRKHQVSQRKERDSLMF